MSLTFREEPPKQIIHTRLEMENEGLPPIFQSTWPFIIYYMSQRVNKYVSQDHSNRSYGSK